MLDRICLTCLTAYAMLKRIRKDRRWAWGLPEHEQVHRHSQMTGHASNTDDNHRGSTQETRSVGDASLLSVKDVARLYVNAMGS